jgi:hypothetical protein
VFEDPNQSQGYGMRIFEPILILKKKMMDRIRIIEDPIPSVLHIL